MDISRSDNVAIQKMFEAAARDALQNLLESGAVIDVLPDDDDTLQEDVRLDAPAMDFNMMSEQERMVVIKLKELARQLGSDQGAYDDGVLEMTFKNKQAAKDYMDFLEDEEDVLGYEVEVYREDLMDGIQDDEEYDFDSIMFDGNYEFDVLVYINPEIVMYAPVEIEISDEDGDGMSDQDVDSSAIMMEIKRKIKVNFRGRRRVKMACAAGFKYNPESKVCVKITGAEVAKNRISHRKAVRTRRAKGQAFKVRVVRKTRKARRFRKSMGLKDQAR